MKHAVVVFCETADEAKDIAADLLMNLLEYEKADGEYVYYGMSDLAEDISGVILLTKKEDEEE